MKGLVIFTEENGYFGVANLSCLVEYMENDLLADDINDFYSNYINEDTQLAEISIYSVYDAIRIRDKIEENFEPCYVIAHCDLNEDMEDAQLEFIGYDVCADDYYTSPIGLEYLAISLDEAEYTGDMPFFDNLENSVRYEYNEKRNSYGIFDDKSVAKELAEYCNWLAYDYEGIFYNAKNFRAVKIYLAKQNA
ncbi:MAG: hypothetical protein NC397_07725 [Clostridium sp.]|nr:hypothetical protein [Clostridium sp.]